MLNQFSPNVLIKDYDISEIIIKKIEAKDSFFIGRIGGSDYEIIKKVFFNEDLKSNINFNFQSYNILREFNGYFDKKENLTNLQSFYSLMLESYYSMDLCSYGNLNLIHQIENNSFSERDEFFIKQIVNEKWMFNYNHFEKVNLILDVLGKVDKNLKILVISPFKQSVEFQKDKLSILHSNKKLDNLKILTLNTKITYNSNIEDLHNVKTENFLDECIAIEKELQGLDFDVALLSCGSYAMPLGSFIKNKLNKKSIYIGGILNVIFGIYGERFDTPFYRKKVNQDYVINPIENGFLKNNNGGKSEYNEGFRAYFGEKKGLVSNTGFTIKKWILHNLKRVLRYAFKKIQEKINFRRPGSEFKF